MLRGSFYGSDNISIPGGSKPLCTAHMTYGNEVSDLVNAVPPSCGCISKLARSIRGVLCGSVILRTLDDCPVIDVLILNHVMQKGFQDVYYPANWSNNCGLNKMFVFL